MDDRHSYLTHVGPRALRGVSLRSAFAAAAALAAAAIVVPAALAVPLTADMDVGLSSAQHGVPVAVTGTRVG